MQRSSRSQLGSTKLRRLGLLGFLLLMVAGPSAAQSEDATIPGDIGELTVEGHCDERGSIEYNLSLGQRRARAVRDYLVNKPGLSGVNIGLISKGEEEPAVPNARTEDQHQQNRRAEFSVR